MKCIESRRCQRVGRTKHDSRSQFLTLGRLVDVPLVFVTISDHVYDYSCLTFLSGCFHAAFDFSDVGGLTKKELKRRLLV